MIGTLLRFVASFLGRLKTFWENIDPDVKKRVYKKVAEFFAEHYKAKYDAHMAQKAKEAKNGNQTSS